MSSEGDNRPQTDAEIIVDVQRPMPGSKLESGTSEPFSSGLAFPKDTTLSIAHQLGGATGDSLARTRQSSNEECGKRLAWSQAHSLLP
jgi:hypothetical protein